MKARTWKVAGWIVALGGALTLAHAGQDGSQGKKGRHPSQKQILEKYDKDGDGRLSDAERRQLKKDRDAYQGTQARHPGRDEMMKRFDKDGDGQLDEEERAALRAEMGNREFPGSRREMRERYDMDGDGELNDEERSAMRDDFQNRRKVREQQGE